MERIHSWELEIAAGDYDTPSKAKRIIEGLVGSLSARKGESERLEARVTTLEGELYAARNALGIARDKLKTTESGSRSISRYFEGRVAAEVEHRSESVLAERRKRETELEREKSMLERRNLELSAAVEDLEGRLRSWQHDFEARVADAERSLEYDFRKKELPLKSDFQAKEAALEERRRHLEEELRKRRGELESREAARRARTVELEEEYRRKLGGVTQERDRIQREIEEQKGLLEVARRTWDAGMAEARKKLEAKEADRRREHDRRLASMERAKDGFRKEATWLHKRMQERQTLWEEQARMKEEKLSVLEDKTANLEKALSEKEAEFRATMAEREQQFSETLRQMAEALEKAKKTAKGPAAAAARPIAAVGKAAKEEAAGTYGVPDLAGRQAKLGGISPQDLVFGIAHQIRNPLAIIKSHAAYCLRTLQPEKKVREPLEAIIRSVENLGRRLDDLVDLTRPRTLHLQEVALRALIEQVCILVQPRCQKQKVELDRIYPDRLPQVQADPEQVKEGILHLLINALDAMPGGGKLKIEVSAMGAGNIIQVQITDTGQGIPPEHQEEIYRPFFSTKPGGVGLGLTLATQIFGIHGGAIIVDTEPKKGTTVKCYLPVKRAEKK